ncbi:Ribosome biogenesis protein BMS1 [Entamoeba marina]
MDDTKRPHRPKKSGVSHQKKKLTKQTTGEKKKQIRNNPKAFVASTSVAARKHYQYSQTRVQEKLHVPMVDRTVEDPPPIVVVVAGPPQSGKTTLIQALVKQYTKQKINVVNGPITLITGKRHRMTLIECPNDIEGMIDCSKVADVVLMTIDGSFGYEMESFEFLTMLQAQGFPKVLGCVTHLDKIKTNKKLRRTKKALKRRFWKETYDGAKVFNFSGLQHGSYPTSEVKILARHIAVLKTRPLVWRGSHSYLVADRVEDLTDPQTVHEDKNTDRTVALYGYVRGTNLRTSTTVCIAGLGDYRVEELEEQPDPCPFGDEAKRLKARTQTLFAPMCDVGGMRYDKDAAYVTLPTSLQKERDDNEELKELVNAVGDVSKQLNQSKMQIVEGLERRPVVFSDDEDFDNDDEISEEDNDFNNDMSEELNEETQNTKLKIEETNDKDDIIFAEEGLDVEEEKKKWGMIRLVKRRDLMKEIYGKEEDKKETNEVDDLLVEVKNSNEVEDTSKIFWDDNVLDDLVRKDIDEDILKKFIPRNVKIVDDMMVDVKNEEKYNVMEELDDDQLDKMVQISNGEVQLVEQKRRQKRGLNGLPSQIQTTTESTELTEDKPVNEFWDNEDTYMKKVQKQLHEQNLKNRSAFVELEKVTRIQVEGAPAGTYVRIVIKQVPSTFITKFDPKKIILVGGVLRSEEPLTLMQAVIIKHRWYPKLLKTKEPLVISVGWRRYQSVATFSMEDYKGKQRMLKYTPKGVFCLMSFFGPAAPSNTGVLAFESLEKNKAFRPCLSGNISNVEKAAEVSKKLKLVGNPKEIKRNTAFIKGMFNSTLEVSKFIGAKIQTVSGIRGQIKKADLKDPGVCRATFESKLVMSDIVFMKGWIPVKLVKFYNPMTDLTGNSWDRMRLLRELKMDHDVTVNKGKSSSKYIESKPKRNENHEQKVKRLLKEDKLLKEQAQQSLHVTKKLMRNLPFAQQLKLMDGDPSTK